MVKDFSAEKRFEYNQELLTKEREIESFKEEEKNLVQAMEDFNLTMMRSFSKLEDLNQELVQQDGKAARTAMHENQVMAQLVKRIVDEQKQSISNTYSKLRQEKEHEIEMIQHKRDSLPWKESKNKKED